MDPKKIVADGYDRIGGWYAEHGVEHGAEVREKYTLLLIGTLPEGDKVLDLGCGAGVPTAQRLAQRFQVTRVDISAGQVSRARLNVPDARFILADMTELDLPPESFDGVAAFFSIIHVPRHQHPRLFQDVSGWLKPGGMFVAGLGAGPLDAGVEEDWHGAPMFWSSFGSDTNKRLIEEAGLVLASAEEVTIEEDAEPVTFLWVVARKPREKSGDHRLPHPRLPELA